MQLSARSPRAPYFSIDNADALDVADRLAQTLGAAEDEPLATVLSLGSPTHPGPCSPGSGGSRGAPSGAAQTVAGSSKGAPFTPHRGACRPFAGRHGLPQPGCLWLWASCQGLQEQRHHRGGGQPQPAWKRVVGRCSRPRQGRVGVHPVRGQCIRHHGPGPQGVGLRSLQWQGLRHGPGPWQLPPGEAPLRHARILRHSWFKGPRSLR